MFIAFLDFLRLIAIPKIHHGHRYNSLTRITAKKSYDKEINMMISHTFKKVFGAFFCYLQQYLSTQLTKLTEIQINIYTNSILKVAIH